MERVHGRSFEMNFNLSHSFTMKRKYTKYHQDTKLVKEIFEIFKNNGKNTYSLNQLSKASGIPHYTLSKWRKKFEADPNYIPGSQIGRQHRIFTDDQETMIADFIRTQFIKPGVMVRRRHLQKILYMLWESLNLDNRQNHKNKLLSRNNCTSW